MTAAPKSTKILIVLKKATIKIRLPLPAHSCLDDDLGSWESGYNFLKNSIMLKCSHKANQMLPSGGSDQTALMLIWQTKLLNCQQFTFRKNPSGADWCTHVEEPDNGNMLKFQKVVTMFRLLDRIN